MSLPSVPGPVFPIALLLLAAPAGAAEPLLVVLRAAAPAPGPFVRLGDVAELSRGPARLRARVGEILLGFAPEAGAAREIGAEEVRARIREAGIGEGLIQLQGEPRVAVHAAGGKEPAAPERPPTVPEAAPRRPPPGKPAAARPRGEEAGLKKGDPVLIQRAGRALVLEEPGRLLGAPAPDGSVEVQKLRTGRRLRARPEAAGVVVPVDGWNPPK